MKLSEVIFTDNIPTLDLHGFDRDYTVLKINEFITDNTHPIYQQFYVFFFIILSYRLFKIN